MAELYGRKALLKDVVPSLVGLDHHGKRRIPPPRQGYAPVLSCVGGQGSGKTAVLEALAAQYQQRVPQAYADLGAADFGQAGLAPAVAAGTPNASTVSDLLFLLSFRLSKHPRDFGKALALPRLTQGLVAVSSWQVQDAGDGVPVPVRPDELDAASRRLGELIRGSQPDPTQRAVRVAMWVDRAVQAVGPLAGLPAEMGTMVQAIVETVATELFGQRAHRAGLAWWATRDVAPMGDAYDQLGALAMDFRGEGVKRTRSERYLLAALLEDVADYYGPLRTANSVPRPLLLLDNVHTAPGVKFLKLLLAAHHDAATPRRAMRPVVVTTALGKGDDRTPDSRTMRGPVWRAERPAGKDGWLLPVRLAALELDDILYMFGAESPPPGTTQLVLRLSDGRAAIVHALVDAVIGQLRTGGAVHPAALLDTPAAGRQDTPVRAFLLERLLPDATARGRLTYYAPALDDGAAHQLSSAFPPGDHGAVPVQRAKSHLRDNHWEHRAWPGLEGPFVGDRALRVLLLHALRDLAGRAPEAGHWRDIHRRLRHHYDPQGLGPGADTHDTRYLHHSLALGETDVVVRTLHHRFAQGDALAWLAAVNLVCAAPHPPPGLPPPAADALPCAACAADSGPVPVHQAIELLVLNLWRQSAPMAVPGSAAIDSIGLQLLTLSQYSGPAPQEIFYRAHEQWPAQLRGWVQAPDLRTAVDAEGSGT
ncbi:hypothetical protein AB0I49_34710 [Streptomyces sp. NPDC050617]|uniref:hypothetical protein n=1 Tax=Streptomyces sp. NPDC050617 TaxID=3154628 RepID=UPI0034481540